MSNKIVNLSYLIESSLNDEEYVKMMIEMYVKNTPDYLINLQALLDQNELEELKRLAHKFKASITIMGIDEATTLIETLEKNIADNTNLDQLHTIIQNIDRICKESLIILKEILASGTPLCK